MIRNDDSCAEPTRLIKKYIPKEEQQREVENLGSKKQVPNTVNCPISQSNS